jgi:hypothetical protein
MTEQLKQAFERAQQLPEDVQNMLAKRLLEEIDEREWEQIVSKPRVHATLRILAKEALGQYQQGETEDGGFAVE